MLFENKLRPNKMEAEAVFFVGYASDFSRKQPLSPLPLTVFAALLQHLKPRLHMQV